MAEIKNMNKKLFSLIIVLHIIAWFVLKPVWPFSDDYCYAYHAYNFDISNFKLADNVFQNRFGVYLPVSGFFYLFGISPYTISLWPLLASLLTITLVYLLISKIVDEKVALISSFLISINILQINYSTALFPDIFIALYATLAILSIYYGRELKIGIKVYPFLFTFCVFAGALTKETIALIFPFILFVFILDLSRKQHFKFWKQSLLFGGIFLVFYLFLFYSLSGDLFYKLKATIDYNNAGLYTETMKEYISASYSKNIFKWLTSELALIFLLLFATSTLLTLKKYHISNFKVFITIYSFSLLFILIVLFHTNKYGVLFMMERVWMLSIPPLCILTAYFITNMHQHFCVVLVVLFSILTWYNFDVVDYKRGILFALFFTTMLITYYLGRKNSMWNNLLLIPFILLAIRFVWGNSNYKVGSLQSSDVIKNQIEQLNNSGKKIILTDNDFAENHIIYNRFKEYTNLTFYPFNKYDSLNKTENLFVIVNTEEKDVPNFILKNPTLWKKEYDSGKLFIYKKTNN